MSETTLGKIGTRNLTHNTPASAATSVAALQGGVLKKSTESPNDSSWNALLCDYIRATRSDNLLPYRAILPNISRLNNIDLGQAGGSHQDPKNFANIVIG